MQVPSQPGSNPVSSSDNASTNNTINTDGARKPVLSNEDQVAIQVQSLAFAQKIALGDEYEAVTIDDILE